MKPTINGFLIVEGTNDKSYLSSLFDVEIITTNGFDINSKEIDYIKSLAEVMTPIILTDSDQAGKTIRNRLNDIVNNAVNVEVDINQCNKNNKHGVAECSKEELVKVLKPYVIDKNNKADYYNSNKLINLGIDNKEIRDVVAHHFKLGKCNSKQLAHRLSLLKIQEFDIVNLIKEYKSGN